MMTAAGWFGSQLSGLRVSQSHGCGWSLAGNLPACEAVVSGPFFVDGRKMSAMASMEERVVAAGEEEEGHLEREDSSSDKQQQLVPETEVRLGRVIVMIIRRSNPFSRQHKACLKSLQMMC